MVTNGKDPMRDNMQVNMQLSRRSFLSLLAISQNTTNIRTQTSVPPFSSRSFPPSLHSPSLTFSHKPTHTLTSALYYLPGTPVRSNSLVCSSAVKIDVDQRREGMFVPVVSERGEDRCRKQKVQQHWLSE